MGNGTDRFGWNCYDEFLPVAQTRRDYTPANVFRNVNIFAQRRRTTATYRVWQGFRRYPQAARIVPEDSLAGFMRPSQTAKERSSTCATYEKHKTALPLCPPAGFPDRE